jgi:hypothetical protein
LLYKWPLYMHEVFSVISGASSVKIWHPPRTGIEKGSEEGRGRGQQYIIRMPEPEQRRHAVSTNISRWIGPSKAQISFTGFNFVVGKNVF